MTSVQDFCNILGSTDPGKKLSVEELHVTSGEDTKQIIAGEAPKPSIYVTELTMPKEQVCCLLDRLASVVAHRFDDRPEALPASREHVDHGGRA